MRVLLITTPVSTHLLPLVPLAWAVSAAGHDLLVAGQPDILDAARSAGLNAVGVGDWYHVEQILGRGLESGARPLAARGRPPEHIMGDYGRVWTSHAERALPAHLELARWFRPDLIISDPLEYTGLIIGGVLGVPAVHHRWGVDPIGGPARAAARPMLADLCRTYGLAELPDPTLVLDPCPPSLQLPGAEPATPMRFLPFNGNGALPPWLLAEKQAAAASRPRRVAVSLGMRTLLLNGVPHVRTIARAFEGLRDVEAVITVDEAYRGEIGAVPENVRMVDPVPLRLLLGDCDAVIHHGGAGTSMTATSFGLPQLVLPQMADQFAAGDRLAAVGAGIAFDDTARQDDPARLRAAVEALIAEPGYRAAAAALRAEMERQPTPSQLVAELDSLV